MSHRNRIETANRNFCQNIDSIFEKGILKWNIRNLGKVMYWSRSSFWVAGPWEEIILAQQRTKSSLEALEVSYENGVNTFDTAEIYGDGRSERVVGEAARRIGRDKVRIISKVFKPSMSHDKMIKACEDSLQRLGTDYLDVYFLHYPVAEEEVTIQERMETMEELKKAGKIRAIGLSNFSPGRDEGGYAIWTGRCDSALLQPAVEIR